MQDMFELNPHEMPKNLAEILDRYSREWSFTYNECESMLAEVSSIGYTFDYGLDSTPYNLRKKTKHQSGSVSSKTLPTNQTHHVRNHSKARQQETTNRRTRISRSSKS
jgi:hypothetical protein